MSGATARYCLALDLVDEPDKIAEYQRLHQRIWPEVADHLRQHGIVNMEIYRLGILLNGSGHSPEGDNSLFKNDNHAALFFNGHSNRLETS